LNRRDQHSRRPRFRMALECIQQPLFLFNRARPTWPAWTRTRHALAAEMSWLTGAVSGAETVNGAATERRTEYPPRWGRISRWVRGRAGWRCELCGVKNGSSTNVLTVHHLDHNKWNLLPWNLAALCQRCHHQVQWAIDFCQSNLTGVYPHWLRPHIEAYNAWAQTKERMEFALND
jgi:hypothetical protein